MGDDGGMVLDRAIVQEDPAACKEYLIYEAEARGSTISHST